MTVPAARNATASCPGPARPNSGRETSTNINQSKAAK
jgi:hypothetical protein